MNAEENTAHMIDQAVQDYLDDLPADRKDMMLLLHQLILDMCPVCDVDMSRGSPTYHHGAGWVALANQAQNVCLQTSDASYLDSFIDAQPKIKTAQGAIYFDPGHIIPMVDVSEVIRRAIEQPAGN